MQWEEQKKVYAPKSVLDAARGNVLHEHAEALSYMERDMAEGVAEMVFADTSIFSGGYPELTERLAKLLDQPEFLADLNERLLGLAEAYAEDKSVMRMQFYRPDKVSEQFQKFALPFQPYQAREGFQWNEQKVFITEDEINAFLAGGGPYSDGRLATYSFFLNHEEKAERAAFLKDRYGVGGSSHALSRADNSHANYDGRGLELARGSYGKPDALVKLNWNQAAERVAKLIDQSLYLKPADYSRMPSYEREQMANRVIGFYHRLPDEVERPFERELLNEDARKKLPVMLADSEQAAELLEKMDAALLSVPLDSPDYAEKSKILADLHQYVEGTYTIFPEKKKAIEISASETGQISLFDIWVQEQESKEHSTTAVVEEPQKQAVKYSRYIGDYLYLEDDSLYKIERVTDSLIYLKDMERPAWAARVLRPNQYDAELAKNPLNDYLLAGQESALKDSRCVYKECLYTMLDAVQQSEIYPYLRDRDVDADEAEKELRNKIDELLEQNAETAPLYLEASENWENFKDWLVEDIFQRTYQDMMPDSRDAVALYQNDIHAPRWVRGMMVDAAVQEIKTVPEKKQEEKQETPSEPKLKAYYRSTSQMEDGYVERIAILQYPNGKYYNHYGFDDVRGEGAGSAGPFDTLEDAKRTLKAHRPDAEEGLSPLSAEAENEYHALKERYPDALVGFEQNGFFEFYGDDAKRVTELIDTKMLRKETVSGEIPVTGFPREQWAHFGKELWKCGESVYLSGQGEDGTHHETKYLRREEYLPRNADVEIDGREFRVDSVDFKNRTVSLQDMTLAKEARYPIFRTEPLEYVRHLYEMGDTEYHNDIERKVFESLDKAQVAYEDFTPEQMDVIYAVAENGGSLEELLNPEFSPEQMQLIADVQTRTDAIHRSAADDAVKPLTSKPMTPEEVNQARKEKNLPLDTDTAQKPPAQPNQKPINFRITDDDLGAGGAKTKFKANIEAIRLLQTLDAEQRQATAEEQEVLSRYVGWGGIPQAFDEKNADWAKEYAELKSLLPADEYSEARASTLNAFYTSPTVIKAIYEALSNMGLSKGNVLEPSCGVGNFMGLVPESMENIKMYGVELDSVSGRIAQQLYQKNKIAVQGFETMQFPDSFFDCVVGNVPFGNYKVPDKRYDRHNFLIHDYFIAKSLDLVRPGGVVAVVTSSGTMDKKDSSVREYLANRADLVGAIRLPNNAFQRNANTSVVADILFLQKRDRAAVERAEWVDLGTTPEGFPINQYFAQHPEMVLGEITTESTQYGKQETTVKPIEGADLAQQLKAAVENIHAEITEPEITDDELDQNAESLPADPNVKNFSYTNVDGQVYYRENSYMNKVDLPAVTAERVLGLIALRETTQKLLDCQLHDGTDAEVELLQGKLKEQYKRFTAQYGLINSTANKRAFRQDSSYCLLASLEILDEDKNLKRLADIFTKRTIRKPEPVTSVDTPSEALALSIGEKAKVDVPFMAELCGKTEQEVTEELAGVIFRNPVTQMWVTADEYLSGNVREKLATAETFAANHPEYQVNVEYLKRVQPKDLNASEIEVRLGANWIKAEYITDFMEQVFKTPSYYIGSSIKATYSEISGAWNISGKSLDRSNPRVTNTYGTMRVNGYRLLEDALNLRDTKIYDTVYSQFERIPLSPERQKSMIERQIQDITFAIAEAKAEDDGKSFTVKQMEKTKKTLQAKLQKLNDQSRKDDVVTFEQLGVDRLFVDESHFYKNMFLYTKMRNIAGIAQTDAQKSSDMFAKCQYLDEITGGKGVTFATGTPVSNSMVELYTIMRYLQYDTLQKLHLGHFDSWAASFGETVTAIELSPEGTGYRAKTRFARFFNLPELISLFKESADVQTADMLNLPVPEAEYINEVLKPSETQQEMVSSFADRAEQVRNGNVNPKIDNMLKITNDGRKLALDQRLINDLLPDEPESKVNLCVENAYQVWEESTPDKSTQLIFCDLSTPKADGTFNVYDDVREKLVAKGIPREEIAFIHEANTETKKAELFAKVRSGQVRILLGSTPKLGAGTNIQDRLIALHHLDCPWKPSDLEQQEGRILRQGNRNQKVKIFRYVTENTFDSYMWQILENKQKFISQIMTSKSPVRACDDVDDTALTYAEIKALATGNPYIKEKMDLDIQVSKLKLMRANHTSQIYSLESDIARRYPAEITAAKERIAGLKADLAVAKPLLEQDKEKFSITVEDRVYTDRKEAGSAILAACAAMKIAKTEGQIADLGGFAISSRFDAFAQTFKLTIKRQSSYTIELGSDPAGNIQRILNALASIEKTLPQVERRLETLQQQLAEAKEEVQRPFPQEAELNEKSARLAELNALLDMDEKGDDAALGMDEEVTDSELPAPKREIERSADSVKRPSILAQLHEKQAERMAEPKPQKKKSHDMEL